MNKNKEVICKDCINCSELSFLVNCIASGGNIKIPEKCNSYKTKPKYNIKTTHDFYKY